jgi:hypothetical protein
MVCSRPFHDYVSTMPLTINAGEPFISPAGSHGAGSDDMQIFEVDFCQNAVCGCLPDIRACDVSG